MGNGKTHGMDAGVPPGAKDAGLAGGVTSADKNLDNKTVPSATQGCTAEFKIVELLEVVKHKGTESTRPWRARDQYIHCDEQLDSNNPHPEYGRCIRLKARIAMVSRSRMSITPWASGLKGRIISWSYKTGNRNRTNLSGDNKEGFDRKNGPTTKVTTTDDKGWTPVVEFYLSDPVDQWRPLIPNAVPLRRRRLSEYNGDTFDIVATDENNVALNTGLLTVIGLIQWLPGITQMRDNQLPQLNALQSIPEGIVLHCGAMAPGVAEYLANEGDGRRVSAHFAWSTTHGGMVQMVPLDIRASHATGGNHWWGYEWSGPVTQNPRDENQWNEFERVMSLLRHASGDHLRCYTFHSSFEPNRSDPGPGVTRERVERITGLTWRNNP